MSLQDAKKESIRLAIAELRKIDLVVRCPSLGLSVPENGVIPLRAFGTDLILQQSDFELISADTGEPMKSSDRILILHYLLCDSPIHVTDELISFRGLPGGQFYWQPFLARSVNPLVGRIGNDLELLHKNLDRFDWEPFTMGDFGARIHALGKLYMTLIYHCGDDEFSPTADVLFDSGIREVFTTEDTAVLASRICLGLL